MNKVVDVKDIWEFAPHRPPMIWVDQVRAFTETGGETTVLLKADAHYMRDDGSLRPSSCLEFVAQSYGFISICHREFSGNPVSRPPQRAFLASFNDAKFAGKDLFKDLKPGDELQIHLSGARAMGPIILFQGRVSHGETVLCECRMKVFSEETEA